MSGLSRAMSTPGSAVITSGNHGSNRKGNVTPPVSAPSSAFMNPMFSQFFNKIDNSVSGASGTGRVSVFSPPVKGKIGGIPGSQSPSSALRNLKLSSADRKLSDQERLNKERFITLSQESSESAFNLQPESISASPLETWNPPRSSTTGDYQYKKDPRRVVVHPYSPDD